MRIDFSAPTVQEIINQRPYRTFENCTKCGKVMSVRDQSAAEVEWMLAGREQPTCRSHSGTTGKILVKVDPNTATRKKIQYLEHTIRKLRAAMETHRAEKYKAEYAARAFEGKYLRTLEELKKYQDGFIPKLEEIRKFENREAEEARRLLRNKRARDWRRRNPERRKEIERRCYEKSAALKLKNST